MQAFYEKTKTVSFQKLRCFIAILQCFS